LGELKKGVTANAYVKKGVGSVPSKFETILYPPINSNISKMKGFGSKVGRFGPACTSQDASEEPGPGNYITTGNSMNITSDSMSRKGYGNGFISKSIRFPDNAYQSYWQPGPG
jgi:hypothetical protein